MKTKTDNEIKIPIDPKIYPLEAVYGAAYVFLDRAYLKLDGDPDKKIIVTIKAKKNIGNKGMEKLVDDFLNTLLNYGLRVQISKNNRKIREYIVGSALFGAIGGMGEITEKAKKNKEDWQKDELGIAVPWEEKYKKNK